MRQLALWMDVEMGTGGTLRRLLVLGEFPAGLALLLGILGWAISAVIGKLSDPPRVEFSVRYGEVGGNVSYRALFDNLSDKPFPMFVVKLTLPASGAATFTSDLPKLGVGEHSALNEYQGHGDRFEQVSFYLAALDFVQMEGTLTTNGSIRAELVPVADNQAVRIVKPSFWSLLLRNELNVYAGLVLICFIGVCWYVSWFLIVGKKGVEVKTRKVPEFESSACGDWFVPIKRPGSASSAKDVSGGDSDAGGGTT